MKKIEKFFRMIAIPLTIALIMSCLMSLVMSLIIVGKNFSALDWLKEWGIAFPIAFGFSLVTGALIPKMYHKMYHKIDNRKKYGDNEALENESTLLVNEIVE